MFASHVTKTVTTPSDPAYQVVIRRLSGRKLEKAKLQTMIDAAELMSKVGGAAVMKEISNLGGEQAVRERAAKDTARTYHAGTVLEEGILEWRPVDGDEPFAPPKEGQVEDLEDDVRTFLVKEVLLLSRVKIEDDEESNEALEEDTKNA